MSLLHLAILTPFLFTILVPFVYKYVKQVHTGWFVLAVPITLFCYFASFYSMNTSLEPIVQSVSWIPTLHIHFTVYLDSLSLLFALIITGVGCLVIVYSIFYMSKEREALHNFYIYLLCFMGAMLGIVLSDNLLVLYVFWEITSISSFLLIAYWYQRQRSRYGAMKSLLITVTGGFSMLLGFLFIYSATGTVSIREIIASVDVLTEHIFFLPAMLLILLGTFTKSAQFPFHIWLPDAMEAPTPISAYLHSATMVKAGVYLVARITPVFGHEIEWTWIITCFGLMTLFWGSFMAIRQFDLKALLAYSTISQLGMMMSLLGIGSLALNPNYSEHAVLFAGASFAAIFHLLNHSIFKGCLFMVIGILDHETGTRDIRKLSGIMSFMPISFTLAIIGGLSMAGMPPFSGFLSKEMFFSGVLNVFKHSASWTVLLPIVAWIASILTFVYCLILVFRTFTGKYYPERMDRTPHEAPFGMLFSPVVLAILVVVLFFFPNIVSNSLLEPAMNAIVPGAIPAGMENVISVKPWHGINMELVMTIGIVIFGVFLFLYLQKWSDIYDSIPRRFTLNSLFDSSIVGLERVSSKITGTYMTGILQQYLAYIFIFLVLLIGGHMLWQNNLTFDFSANAPISLFEYSIGFSLLATTIFVLFCNTRLVSIIAVSAIGYMISLFYVLFRAPDLALTQLVVETISTALFLLCFTYLPKMKKEISSLPFKLTHAAIALGVGLIVTIIGLSAQGVRVFEPIARYYEGAYDLAGAQNIVNAILVDFRAFDTMLEIVVLFTAGIGVYTLIKLRLARGNEQ